MLSQSSRHAIAAMVRLAEMPPGVFVGGARLGDEVNAPHPYLTKLLQRLAQEGLLITQRGPNGGFQLARSPSSIYLVEIVEPIDPSHRKEGCLLRREKCCDEDPCVAHERWKHVIATYDQFLRETTLADLAISQR